MQKKKFLDFFKGFTVFEYSLVIIGLILTLAVSIIFKENVFAILTFLIGAAQCPANGLEKENTKCMIGLAALTLLRVKTGLEFDQESNLLTIAHNLGDKDATELIQKNEQYQIRRRGREHFS